MRLSFNIPTYNRAKYLKKNLEILTAQIIELHKEDEVEINISDNASTDDTKQVSETCIAAHPQLHISYHCNEKNLGPDGNFITAMHLAKGEYSLLWGDDDFLKEGGLARIFELAEYGDKNDVQIMLSSTTVTDSRGNVIRQKNFLRQDIHNYLVDFSNINEARAYFFLLQDTAGLLSFISDVVYKTAIIKSVPFNDDFMGTHYAFLCYWWGWLAKGNKLYYSNISFLNETIQYQPAYGFGVKRVMVDYKGFMLIAEKIFANSKLKNDFLFAFKNTHPILLLRMILLSERYEFVKQILPSLRKCGTSDTEIELLMESSSPASILKSLVYTLFPSKFILLLKKIKIIWVK